MSNTPDWDLRAPPPFSFPSGLMSGNVENTYIHTHTNAHFSSDVPTVSWLLQKSLVNLVHHMGGTIRKDFSTKVSHLIAYSTHGEKYRVCVCVCFTASGCLQLLLLVFVSDMLTHEAPWYLIHRYTSFTERVEYEHLHFRTH